MLLQPWCLCLRPAGVSVCTYITELSFVFSSPTCITLTAVGINYQKTTHSCLAILDSSRSATLRLRNDNNNTTSCYIWGSAPRSPKPTKTPVFAASCDHSDCTAEACESSMIFFCRGGTLLSSSWSLGVWNVLTKPDGENTQTMSNFVIFFPLRSDSAHTNALKSSPPNPNYDVSSFPFNGLLIKTFLWILSGNPCHFPLTTIPLFSNNSSSRKPWQLSADELVSFSAKLLSRLDVL